MGTRLHWNSRNVPTNTKCQSQGTLLDEYHGRLHYIVAISDQFKEIQQLIIGRLQVPCI
jgi:hypothetical protein